MMDGTTLRPSSLEGTTTLNGFLKDQHGQIPNQLQTNILSSFLSYIVVAP
jgi:hypothetical protein